MKPNSPARARSKVAAPDSVKTSKPREWARPEATRGPEKVPVAPEAKVAVKVARSSFSTGSVTPLSSAAACPTAAARGRGRAGGRVGGGREVAGGCADGRAQGQGALGDHRGQDRPPDRLDGPAEELAQVDQVA